MPGRQLLRRGDPSPLARSGLSSRARNAMGNGKWIPDLTPDTPLADAARRVLTVRLEVVRDSLPLALDKPEKDPEYVHQLRVGTRRARAALDIFAACLPPKVIKTARKTL